MILSLMTVRIWGTNSLIPLTHARMVRATACQIRIEALPYRLEMQCSTGLMVAGGRTIFLEAGLTA